MARLGKRIRTKRVTSKLKQGLNFSVMLTFGFATIISLKNLKAIKRDLCRFSMMLKMVIFFLSKFKRQYFAKSADLFGG